MMNLSYNTTFEHLEQLCLHDRTTRGPEQDGSTTWWQRLPQELWRCRWNSQRQSKEDIGVEEHMLNKHTSFLEDQCIYTPFLYSVQSCEIAVFASRASSKYFSEKSCILKPRRNLPYMAFQSQQMEKNVHLLQTSFGNFPKTKLAVLSSCAVR